VDSEVSKAANPSDPPPPALANVVAACNGKPEDVAALIDQLVAGHGEASESVINLVASHNRLSPAAMSLLASSTADHIMSGRAGEREHAGAGFIDAIDAIVVQLSGRLFSAEGVEYRAMSGALANGLALIALAEPGDTIMALPARFGGHSSYRERGYAGARGLRVVDIPCRESDGAIDLAALRREASRERARVIVVGTAWMLEPLPVADLRSVADAAGAKLLYDGAHVLGLVAGGQFQNPLREGAHVLTGSTQKTLGGPVGGLVLSATRELGEHIGCVTSTLISNYHNNRIAALAMTLAETVQFGNAFASAIVGNARSLARAMADAGLPVVGRQPNFTDSHVVLLDPAGLPDDASSFRRLEAAGILTTKVPLAATYPERRALRLGTPAVSRVGMGADDMRVIATLVRRVLIDGEAPDCVAIDAAQLARKHPDVKYCFANADKIRGHSATNSIHGM